MMRAISLGLVACALSACGAKTGLRQPRSDAGSADAPIPRDGPLPDVFFPDSGPEPPDRCIELPPSEPPRTVEVSFVSRILSAEVYFLVDVTGSMGEEIDQIRGGLRDTIIPQIRGLIPGVRFSVGRYADFPVVPYGSTGGAGVARDEVYRLEQASTSDLDAVARAVDRLMMLQSGGDVPESTTEALYVSASGATPAASLVPERNCPPGTVGYPCFEADGSRIFLLFTDAPFHNGPEGAESYTSLPYRNASYEQAASALRSIGAKVLGLYSGPPSESGWRHLLRVARDTGAVRPDGTPIVFDIGANGSSLGFDVVEAVRTLVEDVPLDVGALVEDWPGDALDANEFVVGIRAVSANPASGATVQIDRFLDVRPGTRVTFAVDLANERIMRSATPQVYRMTVVLRGDEVTRLSETVVDVVIPAIDGRGCADLFPGLPR